MHKCRAGYDVESTLDHSRDSVPVDVGHREDIEVELPDQLLLSRIETPDPHQRHLGRIHPRWLGKTVQGETTGPQCARQRHSMNVAARRRLGSVQITMRVDPDHSTLAVNG